MPKLTIDGREVEVLKGITVLQACELSGVEIPRFCYHERLSVAGNCRMCLVEMERAPKPIASCAMPVGEGMVIKTDTPLVQKARQGTMEFLLINHPLDCPICDQGGECDLQDQAMAYGYDRSRYSENKRAVAEKEMGPIVKTVMTRCIQCTRCVRFATEIAGVEEVGLVNRGEHAEITTLEKAIDSELSGNLIDVCPVGALTGRPYAFHARPWELRKINSIDVMDAVGSNIRIDARGRDILRVLPRLHERVNEEWLADKSRYAIDGLKKARLDRPYLRDVEGKLKPCSWDEAFDLIAHKMLALDGTEMAALAGDLCDGESMMALKLLMQSLGVPNIDCRQDGAKLACDPAGDAEAGFLFNSGIAGVEEGDAILLIGSNPRWEAPLINARIRKRSLEGDLSVGMIGPAPDLTYAYEHLGEGPDALAALARGEGAFAEILAKAEKPLLILGQGALARPDGCAILALARQVAERSGMAGEEAPDSWNGFNVLHTAAGRVAGLMMGFLPQAGGYELEGILASCEEGTVKLVYLLGADEIDTARLGKAFVIYQGHIGDAGANRADVILPGAAYTEKNGTYVNTEGRVQLARLAVFPPGDAREDWTILRALSARLKMPLPFDNIGALRKLLIDSNPRFGKLDRQIPGVWGAFGAEGPLDPTPITSPILNYYRTDPISRASATMAACSAAFVTGSGEATGIHG
ncbi:MAG: NADH-quinone oxidoreductase subunit G [Rhodospirillales bacterium]|nr:NADH-quinone oxidoreductase subunit G [Rhodospirillales bacterium]